MTTIYQVSVEESEEGQYVVRLEKLDGSHRHSMSIGTFDKLERASAVAFFVQEALSDCRIAGVTAGYEGAMKALGRSLES